MYFGDLVSVSKALWFSLFCLNVLYPLNKIDMTTSTKRSNVFHNAYLRYIAHRHTYISIVFNFPQKNKVNINLSGPHTRNKVSILSCYRAPTYILYVKRLLWPLDLEECCCSSKCSMRRLLE